jgi:hypothetical protein
MTLSGAEHQKLWRQRHPELYRATENAYRRKRYAKDDEYAAKVRDKARAREALIRGFTPPPPEAQCSPRPADNLCQCCGASAHRLLLDHDHDTGEFRGWVCDSCNIGMLDSRLHPMRKVSIACRCEECGRSFTAAYTHRNRARFCGNTCRSRDWRRRRCPKPTVSGLTPGE